MNILNLFKADRKPTFYDQYKYIIPFCLLFAFAAAYPSISSNYTFFINSQLADSYGDNDAFKIVMWGFAALVDCGKSMFFSSFAFILLCSLKDGEKPNLDAIFLVMAVSFFSASLFFSYNGLSLSHDKEQEQMVREEISKLDSPFEGLEINGQQGDRQTRKALQALEGAAAAVSKIDEKKEEKKKALKALQEVLTSKNFYWLLLMDLLVYLCLLCKAYIQSKKESGDNEPTEEEKDALAALIGREQARYRSYAAKGEAEKCEQIKQKLLALGGRVPSSTIKTKP